MWNDRLHTALFHNLHEHIGIVTLIADDGFGREFSDQPFRLPDSGYLPAGEDEGQRWQLLKFLLTFMLFWSNLSLFSGTYRQLGGK